MLSSISGLYPLAVSSTTPPAVTTDVSRHCQVTCQGRESTRSLLVENHWSRLRETGHSHWSLHLGPTASAWHRCSKVFSGRKLSPSWALTKCSLNTSTLIDRTQTSPSSWHAGGKVNKPFLNIRAASVTATWDNRAMTKQHMKSRSRNVNKSHFSSSV